MPFLSRWRYALLAIALFVVFAAVHVTTTAPLVEGANDGGLLHRFVQTFELRAQTFFFRLRGEQRADDRVVVLELDERGVERFGLWPWTREVMAEVLEKTLDARPKAIGLDVSFTDLTSGSARDDELRSGLQKLPASEVRDSLLMLLAHDPDERLAAAFTRGGAMIVQGAFPATTAIQHTRVDELTAALAATLVTEGAGSIPGSTRPLPDLQSIRARHYPGLQPPLSTFLKSGNRFGHLGAAHDLDGTIRRAESLVRLDQPAGFMPSLGVAIGAAMLDAKILAQVEGGSLEGIVLDGVAARVIVPMSNDAPYTLINYPGGRDAFRRVSVVEVLDGTAGDLEGRAVLIGNTIVGSSGDQRSTPFAEQIPGVYTHASLLSNVLAGSFLERPWWARAVELIGMLVLALLIAIVTPRVNRLALKISVPLTLTLAWSVVVFALFLGGFSLQWLTPTAFLAVTSFSTIFLGYVSVDREKLKMRSTFSRYLGEDVMDIALQNPERLNRGEKREMTVLFSDIRGFTSLSEHMPPEQLADFINQYLSPMTRIVFDEKGTLDKYIGDAVMAFWNAPLDQPDHALRSCRAAVHMLEQLEVLKAAWRAKGLPELEIGIGINTGSMVVGNMGSDVRVDYTVLGDAVNLASRLEGTNKEYGTRIIIGESTRAAAGQGIVARKLGAVRVKGKRLPVAIFELRGLGAPTATDGQAIAAFETGLTAWSERRFDDATRAFETVLSLWPGDVPARNYLAAIAAFGGVSPDANWDGVMAVGAR